MVRRDAFFAESMKSLGMRQLAAASIHERLAHLRPRACSLDTEMVVDALTVRLGLWWPWILLPFSAPLLWLFVRWHVLRGLARLQIPMRAVKIRVGYRIKRPTK